LARLETRNCCDETGAASVAGARRVIIIIIIRHPSFLAHSALTAPLLLAAMLAASVADSHDES
jgi:hypothetical protein